MGLVMKSKPATGEELTEREMEVLYLISTGLMDKEIARKLGVTNKTIHSHAYFIYTKLGVRNRVEATNRYNQGILETHYGRMRGEP